jgi:hypothetical protein
MSYQTSNDNYYYQEMYRSHLPLLTKFNAVSRHMQQQNLPIDTEFTSPDSTTRHQAFIAHCTALLPPSLKINDCSFELADPSKGLTKTNIRVVEVKRRKRQVRLPPPPFTTSKIANDGERSAFSNEDIEQMEAIYNEGDVTDNVIPRFFFGGEPSTEFLPPLQEGINVLSIDHTDPGVDSMFLQLLSAFSPDVQVREEAVCNGRYTRCTTEGCKGIVFIESKCIMHSATITHGRFQ